MRQLSFAMKQTQVPLPSMWFFIAFRDNAPDMTPVSRDGKLSAFVKEQDARDEMGMLGVVAPRQYGTLGDLLSRYQLTGIEIEKQKENTNGISRRSI